MKCANDFLIAVSKNDGVLFSQCISKGCIEKIRQFVGYLGGAGLVGILSVEEYLQITTDAIDENLAELFGYDYMENITYTEEKDENGITKAVRFAVNGKEAVVKCDLEDGNYVITDYSQLEE